MYIYIAFLAFWHLTDAVIALPFSDKRGEIKMADYSKTKFSSLGEVFFKGSFMLSAVSDGYMWIRVQITATCDGQSSLVTTFSAVPRQLWADDESAILAEKDRLGMERVCRRRWTWNNTKLKTDIKEPLSRTPLQPIHELKISTDNLCFSFNFTS